MSTLAFFPWFAVVAPVQLGVFRLVPHRVGASLEAEPRIVDALLAPYQEPGGAAVESATVVEIGGRAIMGDPDPERQARLHQLGDAVALAALARPHLFEAGPYRSRDHLAFVLRRFSGTDPRALQVVLRRRDGPRWVAHAPAAFRVVRPPWAPRPGPLELDRTVAAGLLEVFGSARGAALREAVPAFLAACGDGDGTSAGHGLLGLATAFERLVEAREEELPSRLQALLEPFLARARVPRRLATLRRLEASVAGGAAPPSSSIVEAWARDLLRARRAVREGGRPGGSYWTPEAHLAVGSHLFPAAVLARLSGLGVRPVAEADRGALLACAYLAALRDPFARRRSLGVRKPWVWQLALEVAGRHLARLQLAEVLERARG